MFATISKRFTFDAKQFGKLVDTLAREWETTESLAVVRAVKEASAAR